MNPGNTELTEIQGVGKKTAQRIKETLDVESAEKLQELTTDELKKVEGIGPARAEMIMKHVMKLTGIECHRCGSEISEDKDCSECLGKLNRNLEDARMDIEEVKDNLSSSERWKIEDQIDDLKKAINEKRVEEAYDLLEWLDHELAKIQGVH